MLAVATTISDDKELVQLAVAQAGTALQFASEALQADPEVVRAAVAQDAYALRFASARLRADRGIVLDAVLPISSDPCDHSLLRHRHTGAEASPVCL